MWIWPAQTPTSYLFFSVSLFRLPRGKEVVRERRSVPSRRGPAARSIPRLPRMVISLAGCSLLWAHLKVLLAALKAFPTCRGPCLWISDPSSIPFPTVQSPRALLELRNHRQFLRCLGGLDPKLLGFFRSCVPDLKVTLANNPLFLFLFHVLTFQDQSLSKNNIYVGSLRRPASLWCASGAVRRRTKLPVFKTLKRSSCSNTRGLFLTFVVFLSWKIEGFAVRESRAQHQ